MPLFNKKKSQIGSGEPKLIPVTLNDQLDDQPENKFEFDKDYQEGLSLFMENEGFTTQEAALEAVAKELDQVIKPKILPNVTEIETSKEKIKRD